MLRKTTFITILIYDYNSTHTISCVIGVCPVLISNDHHSGVALDNKTGGGGGSNKEDSTLHMFIFYKDLLDNFIQSLMFTFLLSSLIGNSYFSRLK